MPPSVQTLDISPVGRVEGDLDVRVDIENGVVVNAWTQAELFRGFEVILRDKDAQAGLVVTPRARGGRRSVPCSSSNACGSFPSRDPTKLAALPWRMDTYRPRPMQTIARPVAPCPGRLCQDHVQQRVAS